MSESATIGALAAALAKAQGAMEPASKSAVNPHFKSKYADLASVWEACREPLSANGLAVVQRVTSCADGVAVTTMLMHSSGEWMSDACVYPVAARTPQGFGSAITYGRRYGLASMVGISAEDDDGNAASSRPTGEATGALKAKAVAQASAVAAKVSRIVDVAPGQTEAEAESKAKQAAAVTPYQKILAVGARYGKDKDATAKWIKTCCAGKTKQSDLTDEDVAKVEAALCAAATEPPADS